MKAADAAPGAEEGLLGYFLGLFTSCAKTRHDGMQAGGVNAHELLERVAFTALRARHERLLVSRARRVFGSYARLRTLVVFAELRSIVPRVGPR